MTVSLAWRNAVALTNSQRIYGDYFEKTGFVERLPIELVARFQIDYRPSARVSGGTGFGVMNADPVPGNMLRAFVDHIWDACKAGELSYARESHQFLGEDTEMIASKDFEKWLATNGMPPSVHIQAWFNETGVTFGKAPPAPAPSASHPKRRRDLITPLIEAAQRECPDSSAPTIFALLRTWAASKPPRPPLLGVTEDGIQWVDGNDQQQELSIKNLRDRIKRAKTR